MKHSKKSTFIIATFFLTSSFAFSNDPVTRPMMPKVPTVSIPTIDGFYAPSSSGFFTGNKKFSSSSQNQQVEKKQNSNNVFTTNTVQTNTVNTELSKTANNSKKISNQLTAYDISGLQDLGLFNSISGILSKNGNALQESNDSKKLESILEELKNLKDNSQDKIEKTVSYSKEIKNEPKILRFNANNSDCLQILKNVFFSKEEKDGTFLLTGDCKYSQDGKTRSETFFMLFKSTIPENGLSKYNVSVSLNQDIQNETFLSRLAEFSEISDISATRVGNLVTLKVNESNLKFDLLLSLDN